jgi:Methyltransferase domain
MYFSMLNCREAQRQAQLFDFNMKRLSSSSMKLLFLFTISCFGLCVAAPTVLLQRLGLPELGCSYQVALQSELWAELSCNVCIWTAFSSEGAAPDGTAVTSSPTCSSNSSGRIALPTSLPGYYMFHAAVVSTGSGVIDHNSIIGAVSRLLVLGAGTNDVLPQYAASDFASTSGCQVYTESCTDLYDAALRRWKRRISNTEQVVSTLDLTAPASKYTWDPWEPTWECSLEERVGLTYYGDGPKFMCGVEYLAQKQDCLVYSIGSAYNDGFEQGLLAIAPNCEVSFLCLLHNQCKLLIQRSIVL